MRRFAWGLISLSAAASGWLAATAAGDPTRAADDALRELAGLWWAEGGAAQVEIARCGDSLCGRVAWLRSPFDLRGCPLRDVQNSDPRLREREVLGLEILRGLRPDAEDPRALVGGRIYDPGSGRTYRATIRRSGPDRLDLRGYVGFQFIGRTTTWLRVGAPGQCSQRG